MEGLHSQRLLKTLWNTFRVLHAQMMECVSIAIWAKRIFLAANRPHKIQWSLVDTIFTGTRKPFVSSENCINRVKIHCTYGVLDGEEKKTYFAEKRIKRDRINRFSLYTSLVQIGKLLELWFIYCTCKDSLCTPAEIPTVKSCTAVF